MTMKDFDKLDAGLRRGLRAAISGVEEARKVAEAERVKMDALDKELLAEHQLRVDPSFPGGGDLITEPREVYLTDLDGPEYKAYVAARATRIAAMGYTLPSAEHCPALMAESDLSNKEHLLIEASRVVFPEIGANKLLCAGLDAYHRYIDLWVSMGRALGQREAADAAMAMIQSAMRR